MSSMRLRQNCEQGNAKAIVSVPFLKGKEMIAGGLAHYLSNKEIDDVFMGIVKPVEVVKSEMPTLADESPKQTPTVHKTGKN